ncbi:Nuclear protein SNF4 [Verticillium dahliae VDG1]|nr:Nuclear protein SNF4 [Verticillium dahliae VDG1]
MNDIVHTATRLSWPALALGFVALLFVAYHALLLLLHAIAPKPRAVLPSEKTYSTTTPDSDDTVTHALPCWFDRWLAERQASETATKLSDPSNVPLPDSGTIEPASVRVTVVIPAYNEEARILPALEEAGGAVTHGMRHARGEYVLFADADGASRFSDLGKLIEGAEEVRSFVRNFLMRSFHLVLTILTPPATSRLADTHPGIRVAEVPIDWHEVDGSKVSLIADSIRMAVGLAVLRASWMMGVYRRRLT